jgi:FMN phosphatase YigB (HAD superfamily)
MYPALLSLKANGKYILAALSNTMIFPPSHPLSASSPVHSIFDVIISSAHVGLRKPEPEIYTLALETVNKFAREDERWRERVELPIEASEVLFLDDIGENCKAGREAGFGTVKVSLGRTFEAVDVLEEVTGLKLAGSHPRIPVKPVIRKKSDGAKL